MSVERDIENINASLKQVGDQLKASAERADKEIKAHAKLSEETKASVDKLLTTQGELQARLQAAEQMVAKLESEGGGGHHQARSVGSVVAESSEYTGFRGQGRFSVGVKSLITSGDGSAGSLIQPMRVPGIVAPPQQRLTIRDLLPIGRTSSNSVEFVRETGFTNNADVVSEGPANPKPESSLVFEAAAAPVATIAHFIRATKQVLSDAGLLQGYIDARLTYGLKLKEEAQLLKGSGVGLNIDGLFTQASAFANPGVAVQAETAIDRLRLAILQAELAEYPADGIVISPIQWAAIELLKTTDNAYLFANPRQMSAPGLWGRPVVSTPAMGVDEYLVGAFGLGAQLWDREDANITVSTEDRDNFVKNLVTILAEERLALTVYRPEAFVKGEFELVS